MPHIPGIRIETEVVVVGVVVVHGLLEPSGGPGMAVGVPGLLPLLRWRRGLGKEVPSRFAGPGLSPEGVWSCASSGVVSKTASSPRSSPEEERGAGGRDSFATSGTACSKASAVS